MIFYIVHIFVFALIYITAAFCAPSLVGSRAGVYVVLGAVIALEYVYLWFIAKGRFFTAPISLAAVMLFGVFYFLHPSSADVGLGVWVMTKYLVLPYAIAAGVVSAVLRAVRSRIE